jgi:DNA-binding MarR family transcriptional regulator
MAGVNTHAEQSGSEVDVDSAITGEPLTLYLVKRLELAIRALLDDALRPLGLTTSQYTALSVLQTRGALSSAQLARRSFLRPQTMHEMVLALEKRGLIAREAQDGNKRVLLAALTDAGRDLMARCVPAVLELEDALLADLSPGQRATLREGLLHGIAAFTTMSESKRPTPERGH